MGIHGFKYGMTSIAAVASVLVAAPAMAQTKSFDIAAQPAEKAIAAFAKQAGIQVLANGKVLKGKRTNEVRGNHDVDAALEILLRGTGLRSKRGANGGIVTIVGGQGASAPAGARSTVGNGVLVGSVRDHETGAPMKGALVELVDTGEKVPTGDLGEFRFNRIAAGEVTLRISYLGFPEQIEKVTIVGGLSNTANIYLGFGASSEIVVYGQASARAQALNQERTGENSTTVVSSDLLGNFGGRTISEALKRAPGVAFQQTAETGDGSNIIVRGLAPDYNQITLNGVPLPDGSGVGRSASLGNVLANSVSEVVISKTLLPNQDNAGTGGLVEIKTKTPLERPKRYADFGIEGTKRGKGYGEDWLATGTLSAKFGESGNFGLTLSGQYREQDVSNFSYALNQGFKQAAPYLPLNEFGQPAQINEISPLAPYPFTGGGEGYYPSTFLASYSRSKVRTYAINAAAEWQVSDATNLQLDYLRSDRRSDLFVARSGVSANADYVLAPVPALGGEPRYVLRAPTNEVGISYSVEDSKGQTNRTDTLSFRGETKTGAWTLNYRAGFTNGRSVTPARASSYFGNPLADLSAYMLPEATNPETGVVSSIFGPRTGKAFPLPLFNQAGFDLINNPSTVYFQTTYLDSGYRGKSSSYIGSASVRRDFASKWLRYVEVGADLKRSTFANVSSVVDSYFANYQFINGNFIIPKADQVGFEFATLSLADLAGANGALRFPTSASFNTHLASLQNYIDAGHIAFYPGTTPPLNGLTETREDDFTGYLQSRVDIGKLEIVGGARFQKINIAADVGNSVSFTDENGVFDLAMANRNLVLERVKARQFNFLPRVLATMRFDDMNLLRAGFYTTIARPQVQSLSGSQSFSLDLREFYGPNGNQPSLAVFTGNADLKPATTSNFDIGFEHYESSGGAFKLNFFYKNIRNSLEYNQSGLVDLSDIVLPDEAPFQSLPANIYSTLFKPINAPDPAKIYGFEASAEKRLTFLPGALSGLGIYANFVYTKSKRNYNVTWFGKPIYDANGNIVSSEDEKFVLRGLPFDQSPKYSGTIGLTYTKYGFDGSLYYTKQARRRLGVTNYGLDQYSEAIDSLDFRGEYRFKMAGGNLRLYVEGTNLLKGVGDPDTMQSIGGVGTTPKYYTEGYFRGGRTVTAGLNISF